MKRLMVKCPKCGRDELIFYPGYETTSFYEGCSDEINCEECDWEASADEIRGLLCDHQEAVEDQEKYEEHRRDA